MFLGGSKTHIVCRGAKIFFGQFVRVSKTGFPKKFAFFGFFLCWINQKRKDEKLEKETFKKPRK